MRDLEQVGHYQAVSYTKVCHITTVHPPLDTRIFWRECKTLREAGYDVSLIAPHDKEEFVEGIKIIPLPKATSRLKRRSVITLKAFLLALGRRAEIYHFHDPEFVPFAFLLKCLSGKIIIYDIHEYYSEYIPATRGSRIRRLKPLLTPLLRLFLEYFPPLFCDLLVFPTHSLEKAMMKRRGKGLTLLTLPSISQRETMPLPIPWEEKRYDIIHLGTISLRRLEFMLQIAKHVGEQGINSKWLFVGISPDLKAWVFDNYERKFLEEHFHFVERVPFEQAITYLTNSRIGLNYHPLEKHLSVALPIKVLEYMMMGLPVVTTALPELLNLIPSECAVFVSSNHPSDYAKAIIDLLQNPARAMKIGETCRELVFQRLNWESSERDKLLRVYTDLLERRF